MQLNVASVFAFFFVVSASTVASAVGESQSDDQLQMIQDLRRELDLLKEKNLILESRLKEMNITDIVRVLEEHGEDLTDLRIKQGHTEENLAGR